MTSDGELVLVPTEADREEAALAEAAGELDQVDAALARLDDGTFDRCDMCGRPVDRQRLEQNPLLTRCPEHT